MSFQSAVASFTVEVLADIDKAIESISLELYRRIQSKTPVDTGMARANWNIAVGSPDTSTSDSTAPKQVSSLSGIKAGVTDVWISNYLHYVYSLEHGHSSQAPSGMVVVSLQEVTAWVETKFGRA